MKANKITDPKLAEEGVWIPLPNDPDGTECLIAMVGGSKSIAKMQRLREGIMRAQRNKPLDEKQQQEVYARSLCGTVLLDWKNMKGAENADIPFTVERAEEMMIDAEFMEFRNFIVSEAGNNYNFSTEGVRETVDAIKSKNPVDKG